MARLTNLLLLLASVFALFGNAVAIPEESATLKRDLENSELFDKLNEEIEKTQSMLRGANGYKQLESESRRLMMYSYSY